MSVVRLFVLLSLLMMLSAPARALDAVEQAIAEAVVRNNHDALAVLEESVNINSGTMNFAGVRAVGDLFAREFQALGFTTQWIDGAAFGRAGHLTARRGDSGPRLLLIGHLDTVFATDSPFQSYEALPDDRARGPGTTDMKGGNVVMLQALRALLESDRLDSIQVRVVLTGDEEHRGRPLELANAALVDAAKWADVALGFEDGDGNPATAVVARRSAGSWRLQVTGKPAHSSQIFRDDIGYGAIFETARILDQWREALAEEDYLTFNPGIILGGTELDHDVPAARGSAFGKNNVIPQTVAVSGGIRAISQEQLNRAIATMQTIAEDNLAHTTSEFTYSASYPPMAPRPANRELLALYDRGSRDLGHGAVTAVDPRRAGAADISFAADHVDMALDGLGLMGEGGHTVDEVADLGTLVSQAQRAALLMHRLSLKAGS